jgi:hypothetical protein
VQNLVTVDATLVLHASWTSFGKSLADAKTEKPMTGAIEPLKAFAILRNESLHQIKCYVPGMYFPTVEFVP